MGTTEHANGAAELIVAHTSDLHLGGRAHGGGELATLRAVLDTVAKAGAQALVLAGDMFDSHRAAERIVEGAASMMSEARLPCVILPGNHDPATADAVYRRAVMAAAANVYVLGVNADGVVALPDLALEVSGVAHAAYADFVPIAGPRTCSLRWHIVTAHGHWVTGPHDSHRGWLIDDAAIAATGADYVALGHWDRAVQAGDGRVPAYYSGSPELARTINIVRFGAAGAEVARAAVEL